MSEYDIWRTATQVLAIVAITVGVIQRTQYMFLDVLFEVCIFHVPAITSLIIYSKQSQS
ncbi:hypothetical protein KAI10_01300 [Candidatus Bathyarchaeota archaeon]|nr:hypothetical protein [Candidatus Bathyarchaeota archaeon]